MAEYTEQNLRLFRDLLGCIGDIYFWTYDSHMALVDTNCPQAAKTEFFFSLEEKQRLTEIRDKMEIPLPVVLSNSLQMIWIADFEQDAAGSPLYTHLIGPVFVEEIPLKKIERSLGNMQLSVPVRRDFLTLLEALPVIPITRVLEYGMMLHYCICTQKISASDILYADTMPQSQSEYHPDVPVDVHGTWMMEQQMMKMMEEGNPEYMNYAARMASVGNLGNIGGGDTLRELKNYTIIHTALCMRAAIRGGLSPEIAYKLSDQYINGIEVSHNISEIAELNTAMQKDYVTRVHRCRTSDSSSQIRNCCEYIQLHLNEKITLCQLAEWTGYSETYLSKKFKAETGKTISEYILSLRIEQAKDLLISSSTPIQEICETLGFASQSYFGEQFRKATGMTPGEYRRDGRR